MRVATWNLKSAVPLTRASRDAFLRSMDGVAADVWVLSETWLSLSPGPEYRLVAHSRQAEDLRLAPRSGEAEGPRLDLDRRWVAIWSKLPARSLSVQSDPERMACIRVEQPGLMDLVVVGTVLPWRSDQRHQPQTGVAEFRVALESQATEWERLWGKPRSCALCVVGDFNQELEGTPYAGSHGGSEALNRALDRLHLDCATRHLPAQAGSGGCAIDHICVGPREPSLIAGPARPLMAPRLGNAADAVSDHDGAYVDVTLPPITSHP